MAHEVPPLPYAYNALEPHIDEQTMRIHHDKHHAAYVNNLNAALEKHPELQQKSIGDLVKGINSVPEDIRTAVRNNGGGHVNHTMFWEIMGPGKGGDPTGAVGEAISSSFGTRRNVQGAVCQGRDHPVRQRLGLADRRRRQAGDREHGQPGQSADGGQEAAPRPRRLGARLLPEVPESPSRLHRCLVERRQLGRGERAVQVAISYQLSAVSYRLEPPKYYIAGAALARPLLFSSPTRPGAQARRGSRRGSGIGPAGRR